MPTLPRALSRVPDGRRHDKVLLQAMAESNWYLEKAEECGRRAVFATTPLARDALLRDQKNWQDIADRISAAEAKLKKQGLM